MKPEKIEKICLQRKLRKKEMSLEEIIADCPEGLKSAFAMRLDDPPKPLMKY